MTDRSADEKYLIDALYRLREGRLSRRDFVTVVASVLGTGAAMSLLSACGGTSAPAATETGTAAATETATAAAAVTETATAAAAGVPDAATLAKLGYPGADQVVDTAKWKKPGPWKLAHAGQGPTNSWQVMYEAHVRFGVEDKYKGQFSEMLYTDANGNADKQVNDVEDLLSQKPDIMIITAMSPAALVGSVEKAWDMGIPVIYSASKVDTDKYVTWVERPSWYQGADMAEWIAKKLNGKGAYIMLSGIAGISVAEDRLKGGRDTFAKYPDMKELGQAYVDWSPTKGKQATQAFIAANPQIDAVWSDSGLQGMGAIEAFVDAGKPVPPTTGEDLNGFLRVCKANSVDFFATQYPPVIGLRAVEAAVKTMNGEPVQRFIFVPAISFTKEELDKYYQPDYSDDLWTIHALPPEWIEKLGFKKT